MQQESNTSLHLNKLATMSSTRTIKMQACTSRAILCMVALVLFANLSFSEGARLKRAVMLSVGDTEHANCQSKTISERNSSTSVILTGTVKKCDKMDPGKYSCSVQVWRTMKGGKLVKDLVSVQEVIMMNKKYKKSFTEIYGLGNPAFCESQVKEHKTRIFFLNRVDDRLVLAASLLHITLKNLENTQNVIKGIPIVEPPKKKKDPCLYVLCGFGATCQASANGTATCVCPKVTCGDTSGSSDIFAPVCGSDGVTYPSECRVKAAQCWTQHRITIKYQRPCTPVKQTDPCKNVNCGNSARCVVHDGRAKCECLSCDDVMSQPVCGSDQKTYRTECEMRRNACLNAQTIYIMRRAPCDPCGVYNEETKAFERLCGGSCTLDEEGTPQCCNEIECAETDEVMICGSDGRTYMSKCALDRYACKLGKTVTVVSMGSCPTPKEATTVRGSTSIAADEKCPGNCIESSPEFVTFKKKFENDVNKNLDKKNREDIDARSLTSFRIEEVRRGSAVLVYSVMMSWSDMPIDESFAPQSDTLWAFMRLHDPANGVLKKAVDSLNVTLVAYKNPADDFVVEEVCGSLQCENGAGCLLSKDKIGGFKYACDCSVIGAPKRLPVELGCKLANNNRFYENKIAVRHASCSMGTFLTFKDICRNPTENLCDNLECAQEGSTCIVMDGVATCECITCSEEFVPVCGSNDRTYKNKCQLQRENCMLGSDLTVKSMGMCASQCDEVDCQNGAQCEELSQGSALCICPHACVEVLSPVCGSDGITYDNECHMTIAACKNKRPITVIKEGQCGNVTITEPEEGSGDEGSGRENTDECGCRFGATCDATVDDEDGRCVCDIQCESDRKQICGSDGKTYTDECELSKAKCEMQKSIQIVMYEACPDSCDVSQYGCCDDGVTTALGVRNAGCPETCKCNQYGSFAPTCHPTTGQCVCRPGVGGLKCDQCQPGFWNFRAIAEKRTVGCMDCRCQTDGSVRDDCDQMTGQCMCKEGITGVKCSKCANTGSWVSPRGCDENDNTNPKTGKSCEEMHCRYGQECVAYKKGLFICQCPPLSSCDGYTNGKVCGSNGVTYADECQMKVVACREGVVITVQAQGTCASYVKSLKPVIPPIVKPSPTPATTTTTATSTIPVTSKPMPSMTTTTIITKPMVTKTMASFTTTIESLEPIDLDGSGTGQPTDTTIDDEDGDIGMAASGDGTNVVEPTMSTRPGNLLTPETKKYYKANVMIQTAEGMDLVYSPNLELKDTELFAEYKDAIKNKILHITEIIQESVSESTIRDVELSQSKGSAVAVTLSIKVPDKMSLDELQQFINNNLDEGESFTFVDEVVKPIGIPAIPYAEDGQWKLPQFGGTSYMEFEKMSAYSAATIYMTFKTSDGEGLLLYNGQAGGRDFISLAIIGGYVEFRFDTGSGQLSLRSAVRVDDGEWHEVVSRRNRREGMLMVDDEAEISGNSHSGTTALNLDMHLYLGGVDNAEQDRVFKQTGVNKGLTGCISAVSVGEHGKKKLGLSSADEEAVNSYRVAECSPSPCLPSPCENSGKCFITYQLEEFTYKCDCGSRYHGENCEHATKTEACITNPCHESATCVEESDTYRCICPPSRTGFHCNSLIADLKLPSIMEPSYMPMFAGDSFIERASLVGVVSQLEVEIVFFTFQLEGLLFYNGQKESGKGDFVALNIRDGYLEFMYDLGEGPAVIRSHMPVTMNEWHVAKLSRLGRLGDLKLDDGPSIKGESPHQHSQLNLGQPLYIGAVKESVTLPPAAHITTGLMGAIQKFVVNGNSFPRSLTNEDSNSYNVQAFTGHACYRQPCLNGGVCIPSMGEFSCQCKAAHSGETCEIVDETATVPMLQDSVELAVYFDGSARAQYKNHVTRSDNSFKNNYFEIQLKTTRHHGLVFYDGKPSRAGDYIALAVSYGRLHLTFDLGSGPASIVSDVMVNDGTWKTIKIIRNEHKASLQIDNSLPKKAAAPPLAKWLNTVGILWIGGCNAEHLPPRHRGLPKSFYTGFDGCLKQFHVDGILLRLREDILNHTKLATCQGR